MKNIRLLGCSGLTLAAGASVAKLSLSGSCIACAPSHFKGYFEDPAVLGLAAYLFLIPLWCFYTRNTTVVGLVTFVFGAQLGFFSVMLGSHQFCAICLAAFLGMSLAFLASVLLDSKAVISNIAFIPLGLLVQMLLFHHGSLNATQERVLIRETSDLEPVMRVRLTNSHTAILCIYEVLGCPHCREVREAYCPKIAAEFPGEVSSVFLTPTRPMKVPTIVVLGAKNCVFAGDPGFPRLRRSVMHAVLHPAD